MSGSRRVLLGGLVAVALSGVTVGVGAGVAGASTFTVTNTNASGTGSLSQAIASANSHSGADTITFAANTNGHAIAEPSESPTGDLTIQGNGVGVTIIAGELNTNNSNGTMRVSNLTVGDINANSNGPFTTGVVLTNLAVVTDGIDLNSGDGGAHTTGTITNVRVTGGEIDVNSGTSTVATITNTTVENADSEALDVNGTHSTATVTGSTFSNSEQGINANDATLRVVNSTIQATREAMDLGGSITLQNVTATSNEEGLNGFEGSLSMTNTIISAHDSEGTCNLSDIAFTTHGGNIANDNSCKLTNAADHPHTDAHLGAIAANGGPTRTMMPGAGSAAIDGGVGSGCPGSDQRGVGRPQDGNGDGIAVCDSGAVEAPGKARATTTTVAPVTTVTAATTPTTAVAATVAPASVAPVTAAATTQLPRTGSSSLPLGALGVAFVTLGSALGFARRRTS